MSNDQIEQFIDRYVAGEASEEEIELIASRLGSDDFLVNSLVETASLEAMLQGLAPTNTPVPRRPHTHSKRWLLLGMAVTSAMAVGVILWTITQGDRGNEILHPTTIGSGMNSERHPDKPSILPKPSPRRSAFDTDAMRRLEQYVLPTLDLRGLTVAQAVSEIEQAVEEVGFDETAEPMPDFIRMVMSAEAADSASRVPLFRDNLRLLPTLRYLAALDGGRLAFQGSNIVRKAYPAEDELATTRSIRLPPNFFIPSPAPDFRSDGVKDPDKEDPTPDLNQLLHSWGAPDLNGEASYDRTTSILTLTQTPSGFRILKAAADLLRSQIILQVHLKSTLLQFPIKEANDYPMLAPLGDLPFFPPHHPEQISALIESTKESENVHLTTYPAVSTKSNLGYCVDSISTPESQEPRSRARFLKEPSEEPWWGVSLRYLPTIVGEKITLDFEWEMRGNWLHEDPQGLAVYDGLIKASGKTVIPNRHGVLLKRSFKQQDSTSTMVLVIEAGIIDPITHPNKPVE